MTTPAREINEALIREWIAKLRSGEYKQCTGCLRETQRWDYYNAHDNISSFCCLGVFQDLVGGGEWDVKVSASRSIAFLLQSGGEVHGILTMPSPTTITALNHFGICSRELASMNDSGASFEAIANVIEQTLNDYLIRE